MAMTVYSDGQGRQP